MENKLNIYAKLSKARIMLDKCDLKKSGENKFAKYFYYTLDDLMPSINKIMDEVGLFGIVNIDNTIGNLMIIDIDKPDDVVVFTMPSAEIDMKNSNPIQSIASVQTYVRRYLWVLALDISEGDAIDSTEQSELNAKDKPKNDKPKATGKETIDSVKAEVVAMCKELQENGKKDITQETVKKYHVTPNPTGIKDLGKLQQLREDLKQL